MKPHEFYTNVVAMRRYQREFERSKFRDRQARINARSYEKLIDNEIVRVTLQERELAQPRFNF